MSGLDWGLEVVLAGLLAVVLVHAIRLERAVTALRRDRSALGEAVAGFDTSTREAQAGLGQLRHLANAAAGDIAQSMAAARILRDDLSYLTERGGGIADRLEALVRAGRDASAVRPEPAAPPLAKGAQTLAVQAEVAQTQTRARSVAERALAGVLHDARADKGSRI